MVELRVGQAGKCSTGVGCDRGHSPRFPPLETWALNMGY